MSTELPAKARTFLADESELRVVFDTAGVLRDANARFFTTLGRKREEMVGQYIWMFVAKHSIPDTLRELDFVSMSGDARDFVNCLLRPGMPSVWVCWQCDRADEDGLLYATGETVDAPLDAPQD